METFLFDDFFSSEDDPGVEVVLHVRGRDVPIRVKAHISVEDQTSAMSAGVTKRLDPETGNIVVDSLDEGKLTSSFLARCILSWPFVNKDGTPVPVMPQTVAKLDAEAGNQLSNAIGKLGLFEQKAVFDPFAKPSTAA